MCNQVKVDRDVWEQDAAVKVGQASKEDGVNPNLNSDKFLFRVTLTLAQKALA